MREWSLHRRRGTDANYYVATATKYARREGERTTSKRLETNQGRHALTLTRQGINFINVHAESGGDAVNVAGLCDDLGPAAARMDEILTKLLTYEQPDVLCFQEVIDDMYDVLRCRTSAAGDMREWSLHPRKTQRRITMW